MPIRPDQVWFYPIDWRELSNVIRFDRARGRCQCCRRRHMTWVVLSDDGRWWDEQAQHWRDDRGRRVSGLASPARAAAAEPVLAGFPAREPRRTYVVIATAHLDHDPSNCDPRNLAALCQRCHLAHDRPEHQRQRWATMFYRRAMGDLFTGRYLFAQTVTRLNTKSVALEP